MRRCPRGSSELGIVAPRAGVLAVGSLLPVASTGDKRVAPVTAAEVAATYTQGASRFELDLGGVRDADRLIGRTVTLRTGVGELIVIVPPGIDVEVDAHLGAGEIRVFDRTVEGFDNHLDTRSGVGPPALTLQIRQRIGDVKVVRS